MKSFPFTANQFTTRRNFIDQPVPPFPGDEKKAERSEKARQKKRKKDRPLEWQLSRRIFGRIYRSEGEGGEEYRTRKFLFPSPPFHRFHLCIRSALLGLRVRSSSRKPTQPLARIPLINEEHCARPKFCERHTRVHRPREMGGRQGIVQWKGGRRGRKKKKRRRRKRQTEKRGWVEEETLRPVFSSLLLSIFVFSSLLGRISFHSGTKRARPRNSKQSQSKVLSSR